MTDTPTGTVQHLTPEGMHRNPAYSQAVIVSGPARTIYIGGQNAVDATGNIVGNEQGQKLNEIYPSRYPTQTSVAGKTREQVKAELAEAIRTGDIVASGDRGQKLYELFPNQYSRFN